MTVVEREAPPDENTTVRAVSFRGVAYLLLGITLLLNFLSMAVPQLVHHPLTRDRGEVQLYLDVGEEGNLPTWWSVGLLVAAALAHALVGVLARARQAPGSWAWFVSAGLLTALSLDDHTSLHERLDRIGRVVVVFEDFPFYWLVPGLAIGAVVAAALLLLAKRLHGVARWCMIGGCLLMLGAATGGEFLQGLQLAANETGPLYIATFHAEELTENLGVLLMLAAAAHSVSILRRDNGLSVRYRQ